MKLREATFGSIGGRQNDVGFVKISKIFVMNNAFFFGTEPFDRA